MKFLGKKFLTLLLALITVISVGVTVSAAETTSGNEEYIAVTDEIVESIAIEWAEYVCPDLSFDVSGIYEYYNYDDELIGYLVSVTSNGIPYGYVVLDLFQENIITEFVIEENVVNICEATLSDLQNGASAYGLRNQNVDASSIRLHKYLPLAYAVSVEIGGTEIYAVGDKITTRDEYKDFSESISESQVNNNVSTWNVNCPTAIYNTDSQNETVYGHCADIMLKSIPTGYTSVDKDTTLDSIESFSQKWAETNTGSYACAIVAGLNILYQNNCLLNNSSADTYDWLWDDTDTKETTASKNDTTSDIVYGSTTIGKIAPSVVKLAKQLGKTNSSYGTWLKPTYQLYKLAITLGESGILEFGITVNAEDGGTERQGHTVSVVGYRSDKDSSSTLHQYVIVADGWGAFRYMELSAIDFTDKSGAFIIID